MAGSVVAVTGEVLEQLRNLFTDEEHAPYGGVVARVEHRPGLDVALDGMWGQGGKGPMCDGLVWANVIRLYQSSRFPAEDDTASACGGTRAAVIQVGAARCVSTVDNRGRPPAPETMEHEALVGLDDAERLRVAVCRAVKRAEERDLILASAWSAVEPTGPMGGVLAWHMEVAVQLA